MVAQKAKALADFINVSTRYIRVLDRANGIFLNHDQSFMVLTEEEADAEAAARVFTYLPELPVEDVLPFATASTSRADIEKLQETGSVFPLMELLKDKEAYIKMMLDRVGGRGGIIADDAEENSENGFYIYRLN